eukprot:2495925-Rhodomonas_salina.2
MATERTCSRDVGFRDDEWKDNQRQGCEMKRLAIWSLHAAGMPFRQVGRDRGHGNGWEGFEE